MQHTVDDTNRVILDLALMLDDEESIFDTKALEIIIEALGDYLKAAALSDVVDEQVELAEVFIQEMANDKPDRSFEAGLIALLDSE